MKFPSPVSVGIIADLISAEIVGNTAAHATGINEIHVVEQGGAAQVRFQPRLGHLLAAAAENVVSIFDVEADRQMHALQVSVLNMKVTGKQENTCFLTIFLLH